MAATYPIFDGHNDTVTRILRERKANAERSFFKASEEGAIELPKAKAGHLAGGFFAIFTPNPASDGWNPKDPADGAPNGHFIPLPPPVSQAYADEFVRKHIFELRQWETESEGAFNCVLDTASIEENRKKGVLSAIIHIEGAEAIKTDLSNLDEYHNLGLRSLGPVWSRPNDFAHGVPFAFPKSPDTGPGLTEAGFELVKACNQKRMLIDNSHLNEKGFWDIAKTTHHPLVATHSGAWSLANSTRNLTDKQLDAIAESNGVTGLNFCKNFLRADGLLNQPTPLTEIVRHVRYIVDRNGIDHVALGSDFDGAKMPDDLTNAAQLPQLTAAFEQAGFHRHEIEQICWGNWMRVLRETMG